MVVSFKPDVLKAPILGWWFVPANYKLSNGDGRVAEVGVTHLVTGKVKACVNGLHASQDLRNALSLCPSDSTQLFLVKLWGALDGHTWQEDRRCYEKVAAEHRTYLAHITVDHAVREVVLAMIRRGIKDHNERIKRYGKKIYKRLPKPIVQFSKDGVLNDAFDKAISGPTFDRLRQVIETLRKTTVLTHSELTNVVQKLGDQFAMEEGEIWALAEHTFQSLMSKQLKALPKPKK